MNCTPLIIPFIFLFGLNTLHASQPSLSSISQPLFFLGSAQEREIEILKTPKILSAQSAEAWIALFSSPTELPQSGGDLNLISIYGLSVELVAQDAEGRVTEIRINLAKAAKPERYPFTIEEVAEASIKAIRAEFPDETKTKISVVKL